MLSYFALLFVLLGCFAPVLAYGLRACMDWLAQPVRSSIEVREYGPEDFEHIEL